MNWVPGTGNQELGTGNWEPGTGNQEPGTHFMVLNSSILRRLHKIVKLKKNDQIRYVHGYLPSCFS